MKKDTEKYLQRILHSEFILNTLNSGRIPYALSTQFDLYKGTISGNEIVFALSKFDNTPLGYQKAQELLHKATGKTVVLVIFHLSPMQTHRMVAKGIDFIVPGQRMFMPSVLIDLGGRSLAKAGGPIPPAAQFIALYHLEKYSLNDKSAKEIADITGYSYLTVTRALRWISDNVFPLRNEGRRQFLSFPSYKDTLDGFKPFFRNPVIKSIRTEDNLDRIDGVIAGESALGQMTMLAPNGICKAVGKEIKIVIEEDERAFNSVEIWMYSPQNLAKNGICDRISLILSLEGNEDERVIMELDRIKEEVKWL